MEWDSDIATALCVATNGWSTDEEREVYLAALDFTRKVRNQAMARMLPRCDKCGHLLSPDISNLPKE